MSNIFWAKPVHSFNVNEMNRFVDRFSKSSIPYKFFSPITLDDNKDLVFSISNNQLAFKIIQKDLESDISSISDALGVLNGVGFVSESYERFTNIKLLGFFVKDSHNTFDSPNNNLQSVVIKGIIKLNWTYKIGVSIFDRIFFYPFEKNKYNKYRISDGIKDIKSKSKHLLVPTKLTSKQYIEIFEGLVEQYKEDSKYKHNRVGAINYYNHNPITLQTNCDAFLFFIRSMYFSTEQTPVYPTQNLSNDDICLLIKNLIGTTIKIVEDLTLGISLNTGSSGDIINIYVP